MNKGQFVDSISSAFTTLNTIGLSSWDRVNDLGSLIRDSDFFRVAQASKAKYEDIYKTGLRRRHYNFSLFDYSFMQFYYEKGQNALSVRYAYYPNPFEIPEESLDSKLAELEEIEQQYHEAPLRITRPLVRFDYEAHQYAEGRHPAAHLHIGMYPACRIPVRRVLTPSAFCLFIAKHMYNQLWFSKSQDVDPWDITKYAPDIELIRAKNSSVPVDRSLFSLHEEKYIYLD